MSTSARRSRMPPAYRNPLIFFVVVVVLWDLAVTRELVSTLIVPRPTDVAVSTWELTTGGLIWEHVVATVYETLAGFALATVFGIGLAMAAGLSRTLNTMVQPYAVVLQVMPLLAVAPILIAALGFGYTSKIVIAALIAFFPIFVNTLTGLLSVDRESEELFRSLGAGRIQTFLNLQLPTALPVMFAGLKIAVTLALAGAMVGEFIAASKGLGLMVQRFSHQLNMDDAFAVVVILTALGLLFFGVMALIARMVVFWTHESRLVTRSRSRQRRVERRLRGENPASVEPVGQSSA